MRANQGLRALPPSLRYWRQALLASIPLALLARIFTEGPIVQDQTYHEFADQRRLFGVPHLIDVASNVPFLAVGVAGMLLCLGARRPPQRAAWFAFFAGVALVTAGSGYYHWAPEDASLVWDRLPMTVAFMGLFTALVSEHVGERLERWLLAPALALGVASVLWWRASGDLRLYYWVQAAPLVCLTFALLMFRGMYSHRRYFAYALALYVLAKLAEAWDFEVYALTSGTVSGHSAKHLLAAGAILCLYLMLRRRRPAARGEIAISPAPDSRPSKS